MSPPVVIAARTCSAPARSALIAASAPCSASRARTPVRCRSTSMLGITLKSLNHVDSNPWNHWNRWNPWNLWFTISVLVYRAQIPPRRALLAVRGETGGADGRGAGRARSGSAHDVVRATRAAVLDHARLSAVRGRELRAGDREGQGVGRNSSRPARATIAAIGHGFSRATRTRSAISSSWSGRCRAAKC